MGDFTGQNEPSEGTQSVILRNEKFHLKIGERRSLERFLKKRGSDEEILNDGGVGDIESGIAGDVADRLERIREA